MPVKNKKKKDDFQSLRDTYNIFLQELKSFEKREAELGNQIRQAINQEKISKVLEKIVNLKN